MVLRERRRDRQRDKQNSTCQGKKVELFARNMKMEARTKGKKMFDLRKFGLAVRRGRDLRIMYCLNESHEFFFHFVILNVFQLYHLS